MDFLWTVAKAAWTIAAVGSALIVGLPIFRRWIIRSLSRHFQRES